MNMLYKPRPERWPQFTLRGLFVLVTILGVFLGWLGVQVKWIKDRREAIEWVENQGPHSMAAGWHEWVVEQPGKPSIIMKDVSPPFGLAIFGEKAVNHIHVK
jgi:hypothetical protein